MKSYVDIQDLSGVHKYTLFELHKNQINSHLKNQYFFYFVTVKNYLSNPIVNMRY